MGNESTQTPTTGEAAAGDPAEAPNVHEQRAKAVIATITDLVAGLPPTEPTPVGVKRAHRAVPKQFLKSMITLVRQDADVRAVTVLDTAASNDRLQLIEAYEPLLVQAMGLVETMNRVLDTARSKLTYDTLDAYSNIKRMASRPGAKQAAFKLLEKELGRKRRAKDLPEPAAGAHTVPSPGITPPVPPATKPEVSPHA